MTSDLFSIFDLFLIIILCLTALGVVNWLYRQSWLSANIKEVDKLSGYEFEQYLAELFKALGYHVQRTPAHGDFGADLILTKGGVKTAVQAKHYNYHKVNNKAVQEALASRFHYTCDKAMVITNSTFTRAAQVQARSAGVELVDRSDLGRLMRKIKKN